jgi:hypothetical protein
MTISKSEARKLAKNGLEIGAQVLRGVVNLGPDGVTIDGRDITTWLAQYVDAELVLIAAPVEKTSVEDELKTCFTCGRDYTGHKCPYCAEARARLRR